MRSVGTACVESVKIEFSDQNFLWRWIEQIRIQFIQAALLLVIPNTYIIRTLYLPLFNVKLEFTKAWFV